MRVHQHSCLVRELLVMTAGGGVDIRASRHFSIRPVQAEYLLTKIPDGLNDRQNNFRFGTGVVFRFGRT
jgi:hypothetical protein